MTEVETSKKIEYGLFGVMGLITTIYMFYLQYHTPICFDAGMNFTVSRSLNEIGKYATDYQQIDMFSGRVQTGATVIFPSSVLNAILGINSNNMQIVTTVYGILLTLLVFYILNKHTNVFVAFVTAGFLLSVRCFTNVSYMGIGETSMGFFMLLVCILVYMGETTDKKSFFCIAGIAFGLGYLTKTVFLIITPVVGLVFLVRLITKKGKLSNYLYFLAFAVLPILLFEIYKVTQMGINEYVAWWKHQLSAILDQAGVTDGLTADEERGVRQALYHVEVFCTYYKVRITGLIVMMILPIISFVVEYRRRKEVNLLLVLIYGIAVMYIIWWTVMSPTEKLWARRVLMGYVCLLVSGSWSLWLCIKGFIDTKVKKIILMILTIILLISPIKSNIEDTIYENSSYKKQYSMYIDGIEYMKTLPEDSRFYGIGWWENPTISGMSGIKMYDLTCDVENYNNAYYVEESIARSAYEINGTRNIVMAQYDTDIAYENECLRIFKINGRKKFEELESGVLIELAEASDYSFKIHYSAFDQAHGETNKSVFISDNEELVCLELFTSDVDKILLGIDANCQDAEVIIKNMTIKLDDEITVYEGETLYQLFNNSSGVFSLDRDSYGNSIIRFDETTQIFFDIH